MRSAVLLLITLSAGACNGAPPAARHAATQPLAIACHGSCPTAEGLHGAISSAEQNASDVGRAVLEAGGNAVDAAIAVAFALNVTHPSAGNIGGGGFMLIRLPNGQSTAIDYREVAPGAARSDMFVDGSGQVSDEAQRGPRAAGVPGVVAGLALAHEKFGTKPWAELIAPAIRLARDGHVLDEAHAHELRDACFHVRAFANALTNDRTHREATARRVLADALQATLETFGKDAGGAPYLAGELWRQPALANTLELLARGGPRLFYEGELATRMAGAVRAMGGIWSAADLADYRARERTPIRFDYRGHTVLTMPPPSAGGVVLRQVLAASEALGLHALPWNSAERVHLFVEILRRAYADRNTLIADPAFVDVPTATLLSPEYIRARMATIDLRHATPSGDISAGLPVPEPMHTTHFSVVDRSGMAVANTFTLNTNFGALVQIPGTGVTLNNEMDDFSARPGTANAFGLVQAAQNAIAPGKRMLSSMTPTIVARAGELRAVLGSPGGPTITTTVAQVLLQLLDHGVPLERAIAAPRVHHQWLPDEIVHEPGLPAELRAELQAFGHTLVEEPTLGHANCIEIDPDTHVRRAVADVSRGGGGAAAY